MKPTIAIISLFLTYAALTGSQAAHAQATPHCFGSGEVTSPDGAFSARVTRTGRSVCGESKIEFYSGDGHLMSIADYTSNDGQSGVGVIQIQWSPDSHYLVYSLSQPSNRPAGPYTIGIYSGAKNKVKALPVARPEFTFTSDALEVTGGDGKPVRLPLTGP